MRTLLVILALFLLGNIQAARAQSPVGLTDTQRIILESINDRRRQTNNAVLLAPNAILNQAAQTFLTDLLARQSLTNLGNIYLLREQSADGRIVEVSIDEYLERLQYTRYSDGYIVDFVPVILNGVTPDKFMNEVVNDAGRTNRTIISRRMSLGQENTLPFFLPRYREIGIAYALNPDNGRHYYVIVVASQPQVLPVIISERSALNVIAETVSTRDVILRVHNENARPFGDQIGGQKTIGFVVNMRVSETPDPQLCPPAGSNAAGWQAHKNALQYELTPGPGLKTIYVQLCDNQGETVTSMTQVNYIEVLSPELARALNIAQMTQTAAADATLYATYQPTVEAILTATAAPTTP